MNLINKNIIIIKMPERISELLKGKQFFEFGRVTFASNHPDHVYLLELLNENDDKLTVLYDKKHDFLDISNRNDKHINQIKLSDEQIIAIKKLLEESGNNYNE